MLLVHIDFMIDLNDLGRLTKPLVFVEGSKFVEKVKVVGSFNDTLRILSGNFGRGYCMLPPCTEGLMDRAPSTHSTVEGVSQVDHQGIIGMRRLVGCRFGEQHAIDEVMGMMLGKWIFDKFTSCCFLVSSEEHVV